MKSFAVAGAMVAFVAGCSPPAPLPPVTPRPEAGELADVRIGLQANSPGKNPDPALQQLFAKAFADAGFHVLPPEEHVDLVVEISQPLGEWAGAYFCNVTTYADVRLETKVSAWSVRQKCASPNVTDHTVAGWLRDPAVKKLVAKMRGNHAP